MGVVYLAADPVIGRQVAIKVLWPAAGAAEGERLADEARVSGRLTHPRIVPTFDAGEDDGHPFVVMQYIEGQTLAQALAAPDRPTLDTKLRWMGELCDGLQYAHQARVIHRDIKPGNLLIDASGGLRILDFGIAKILSTSQASFTSVGTPAYMAPEQYSRAPVDPRTDVFAAGLVLFEMITHRRALLGDSPAQILGQLMMGPMPRLCDVAPDVNPELAAICDRAIATDPARRYQTAGDFSEALVQVRARGVGRSPVSSSAAESTTPASADPPTAATLRSGPRAIASPSGGSAPPLVPPARPGPSVAPLFPPLPPRKAPGWWTTATTTRWRFSLSAAALSTLLVALIVYGPQQSTPVQSSLDSEASRPMQAAEPPQVSATNPTLSTSADPTTPRAKPTGTPRNPASPVHAATPPGIGRLRLSSDIPGTAFTTEIGGVTKTLSSPEPNALAPGRYQVRAAYVDGDQDIGAVGQVAFKFKSVDIVAGSITTADFALETPVWRNRFENALQKPIGQRAVILERSHQRLKELDGFAPGDEQRYASAAAEQQLVKFVFRSLATDAGLRGLVKYNRIDLVRIDAAAQRIAILGVASVSHELARGHHEFAALVDVTYMGSPQSTTCSGSFEVPGGTSALQLDVDAIVRRPLKGDGRLGADCQIGGAEPLRPRPLEVPVGQTATDKDGRFSIRVEPGRYDIRVERPGYADRVEAVTVSASRGAWLEFWKAVRITTSPGVGPKVEGGLISGRVGPEPNAVIEVVPVRDRAP